MPSRSLIASGTCHGALVHGSEDSVQQDHGAQKISSGEALLAPGVSNALTGRNKESGRAKACSSTRRLSAPVTSSHNRRVHVRRPSVSVNRA